MKQQPHPEAKERIEVNNRLTIVRDNRAASNLFRTILRSVEMARERRRKEGETNGDTGT